MFSDRLNRLAPAFQALAEIWLSALRADLKEYMEYIVDSRPIIPAKGPHSSRGKVACGLCEQSYHYSRKELHYGIKLYAVVTRKLGSLPIPLSIMASGAAQHNLPVAMRTCEL